ncbi:hypothetical protein AV530_001685 [Patagioenas fasciata monilis]|uniref:Uncharacterized protein n=1 Tax=Patagioenas fasciata monilis TaxID=372326 RepID=A0A1V4KNU8_PATFA|nr:hypothetical protein AV530_001685 [Patagioenas fasciata monilis]
MRWKAEPATPQEQLKLGRRPRGAARAHSETRRKNPRFTRYPGTALARVTYVQLQDSGAGTLDPFSSCLFRQGDASSPNLAGTSPSPALPSRRADAPGPRLDRGLCADGLHRLLMRRQKNLQ